MFGMIGPLMMEEDMLESYLLEYEESSTNQTFYSYLNEAQGRTYFQEHFPQFVNSAILYAAASVLLKTLLFTIQYGQSCGNKRGCCYYRSDGRQRQTCFKCFMKLWKAWDVDHTETPMKVRFEAVRWVAVGTLLNTVAYCILVFLQGMIVTITVGVAVLLIFLLGTFNTKWWLTYQWQQEDISEDVKEKYLPGTSCCSKCPTSCCSKCPCCKKKAHVSLKNIELVNISEEHRWPSTILNSGDEASKSVPGHEEEPEESEMESFDNLSSSLTQTPHVTTATSTSSNTTKCILAKVNVSAGEWETAFRVCTLRVIWVPPPANTSSKKSNTAAVPRSRYNDPQYVPRGVEA
jgi:hypothetical protein